MVERSENLVRMRAIYNLKGVITGNIKSIEVVCSHGSY